MKTVPCRGCGLPMLWVTMAASGKKNPLNPEPDPNGNVSVTEDIGIVLKGAALAQARADGLKLYLSHYATCAKAKDFRAGGGR